MNTKNKAIVCILISAFGFSIMNLCVKLSGDLPSIEKSIEPYGAVGCFYAEQVITFLYTDLFLHLPEGKVITLPVYCHRNRFYRQFVYHQAIL